MKTILAGFALMVLAGLSQSVFAAEVALQWDQNPESDLAGYQLYQSNSSLLHTTTTTAHADGSVIKTQYTQTYTSCSVTSLAWSTTYYFRLTALDNSGNESDFSVDSSGNSAEVVFNPGTPTATPTITPTPRFSDLPCKAEQKFLTPAIADGINDEAIFGRQAEEVTIFTLKGRQVFHATRSAGEGGPIRWNCKDDKGNSVPAGVYVVKIRANNGSMVYQTLTVVK